MAQAAEKTAARQFGKGNIMSGVLQTEQRLSASQADALKKRWMAKMAGFRNSHEIPVLDSGAAFKPVTMPYKDAQFLESREFEVVEIARMFGVPQFLLMSTEKSTSWGRGWSSRLRAGSPSTSPRRGSPRPSSASTRSCCPPASTPSTRCRACCAATARPGPRSTGRCAMSARSPPTTSAPTRTCRRCPAGKGGDVYLQPTYMAPLGINPLAPDEVPAPVRAAALLAEAQRLLAPAQEPRQLTSAPAPEEGTADEDPDEDND
ncbi:phage portal protein [Streptomyces noursei]|nr:phage portal protein [Streptomyces noursei]